jgi:threonine/homoserine/homoserine lactone efflux protein
VPSVAGIVLFLAASLPLVLAPGPAVAFVLATSVRSGRRAGLAAVAGVETGYLLHVAAAVAGVSAVIAASATAFTVVKVAGGLWLLVLAWRAWRSREVGTLAQVAARPAGEVGRPARSCRRGLLGGALNPKTAVFYLAFLPQFVRADAGPVPVQLLVFGLLFLALAAVSDSCWALAGAGLARVLPRLRMGVLDRVSAGVFAVLAAVTLTTRRAGS